MSDIGSSSGSGSGERFRLVDFEDRLRFEGLTSSSESSGAMKSSTSVVISKSCGGGALQTCHLHYLVPVHRHLHPHFLRPSDV